MSRWRKASPSMSSGMCTVLLIALPKESHTDRILRTVFRCSASVVINGRAIKRPHLTHEWRSCGSWLMVRRGHLDRLRTQMFLSFGCACPANSLTETGYRAISREDVHKSRKSRSERNEPDVWIRGRGETQTRRANIQGMSHRTAWSSILLTEFFL